jgi:hypothetical protein
MTCGKKSRLLAGIKYDKIPAQLSSVGELGLAVYLAASIRTGWKANVFSPWQDYLPRLEKMMDDVEATVRQIDTIE